MKKSSKVSLRNMTVRSKLLSFSAITQLLIVFLAVVSIMVLTRTNDAGIRRYTVYADRKLALSNAYSSFIQIRTSTRDLIYMYADDPAKQKETEAAIESAKASMQKEFETFTVYLDQYSSEVVADYNEVVDYMMDYMDLVEQIIVYVEAGDIQSAEDLLVIDGPAVASNADAELVLLMDNLTAESDENSKDTSDEVSLLTFVLVAVCVVSFIIVASLCLYIVKQIARPIAKLAEASKKMALGDVDVDCEKINDDDLGFLMDEFSNMAESTKGQVKVAEQISKGDLTVHVEVRSESDALGKALQRLVTENNRILGNIKESTNQVTVGAEQVASASQSLAQGSTEQASALQEITASMNEIAERTKANAVQASEADDLVRNVKNAAVEGNGQMKSMIDAMNDINASSETISKIIKVIDDIAFQTNILALNAAVEAARAGIHGKGFAVVAEEVRNLAAKSASAASETAEMIEDSIHKVNNGTKLAEATAKSLDEIVGAIDKIVALISNIAVASNDQATAVSQVDQAIGQVSTVVQTNSATSEQCAAASEELSNQAANLRGLLSTYKLLAGMQSSYSSFGNDSASYDSGNYNEQIISLDGEFGKY